MHFQAKKVIKASNLKQNPAGVGLTSFLCQAFFGRKHLNSAAKLEWSKIIAKHKFRLYFFTLIHTEAFEGTVYSKYYDVFQSFTTNVAAKVR